MGMDDMSALQRMLMVWKHWRMCGEFRAGLKTSKLLGIFGPDEMKSKTSLESPWNFATRSFVLFFLNELGNNPTLLFSLA